MPDRVPMRLPPPALGMTSLVIGVIGLLLFLLPILGIPLSAFGIGFGIGGLISSWTSAGTYRRWALGGLATSLLALAVNLAIVYAPVGEVNEMNVPRPWRPEPDRPYAPPPARQG